MESRMSYNVYRVAFAYPTAPTHYVLFVETDDTGIGSIFHVTGSIYEGMEYEIRGGQTPRLQPHLSRMDLLGNVLYAKLAHFMDICESIPTPGMQLDDHEEINPGEPLYCCGEWLDDVIRDLEYHGVLENQPRVQSPIL